MIVDLAAEAGGNCELTVPGEDGRPRGRDDRRPDQPAEHDADHASQLYARNVSALLLHLAPEGELAARLGGRDHRRRVRDAARRGSRHERPRQLIVELTILVLAIFLGFEVISKVPTMLHTPLMSGTNAIHGIVIVGAMLVAGRPDADTLTRVVGFFAVVLATANVVGGFVVTDRMLEMFRSARRA